MTNNHDDRITKVEKPKKKHNWMKGFVIPPKKDAHDLARAESMAKVMDYRNGLIRRGR